jgi:hypothetical protein
MKKFNNTLPNNSEEAIQNLIKFKKLLDNYKLNQIHNFQIDSDFNPRESFDLRCFFNLMTEEDVHEKIRTNEGREWFSNEEFIDFETVLQVPEDDSYINEHIENEIYYEKEKILVTNNSDFYKAYKIGSTIDECKLIGSCFYQAEFDEISIYKIIRWHLETGEYGWHV